jgi:hypothetical protein
MGGGIRLVRPRPAVYHSAVAGRFGLFRCPRGFRRQRVFSFVGVLAITLVLFLTVAVSARLILGR